ncbi:MAG: hypothetical protein FWD44_00010 [Oscillospiraceae bacterium]|nr:hypothetical protein [Oscillospiraceae bacterium]
MRISGSSQIADTQSPRTVSAEKGKGSNDEKKVDAPDNKVAKQDFTKGDTSPISGKHISNMVKMLASLSIVTGDDGGRLRDVKKLLISNDGDTYEVTAHEDEQDEEDEVELVKWIDAWEGRISWVEFERRMFEAGFRFIDANGIAVKLAGYKLAGPEDPPLSGSDGLFHTWHIDDPLAKL